ncbi:MAG: FecR family protein [Endomicrobia bacterium]|nr:FecR family protein [Endomicrobiia bacterium]
MKKILLCLVLTICVSLGFSAKVVVIEISGKVFTKMLKDDSWVKCYIGQVLDDDWVIKTEAKSKVVILLYDGTKITLYEKSEVFISKLTETDKMFEQKSGKTKFKVSKQHKGGKFEIKTPTSVMSIRGTEFVVFLKDDFKTEVKVFEGIVAVKTLLGEEIELKSQEKIEIIPNLPLPEIKKFEKQDMEESRDIIKEETKEFVIPEVRMDMTKEEVQRASAEEMKLAEYQQGKSLIDVWGNRVRIEEYIVRKNMQPDQFKMVVLNERENRFDYFTWIATFNKDLPTDLTLATKWLGWKSGSTIPEYYLKESYSGVSNTVDKVEWKLQGNVTFSNNLYTYKQDLVSYKINNNEKITLLPNEMELSYPLGKNYASYQYKINFNDGTWAKETYYWLDDAGNVPTNIDYLLKGILGYNQELVFEASEFIGPEKKIDLIVEPKIFLDAGIIQQ